MEFELLEYLSKSNTYVDVTPFCILKGYEEPALYEALRELQSKNLIDTPQSPAQTELSWGYLRQLEYGEDVQDSHLYGATFQQLITRNDPIILRITFAGRKELQTKKNWVERNPIKFSLITAGVGFIFGILLEYAKHVWPLR